MAFEAFHRIFGPGTCYREFTLADRDSLAGRLPGGLLDLWDEDGWCTYHEGLFTCCDPDFLGDVARAWFPGTPEVMLFAHDTFGSIYLWDGQEIGVLDPHIGQLDPLALDIEELLDLAITRPAYIAKAMFETRVDKLRGLIGVPGWDQIYAYEPVGTRRFRRARDCPTGQDGRASRPTCAARRDSELIATEGERIVRREAPPDETE
jgi:hypothetical protein